MDDIELFGIYAGGVTRFICPKCGTNKDPLKIEDNINNIKRGEKGQTIRSSTGGNNNEDRPFVEMFNSATPTTKEEENSVSLKGIQVNRSLLNTNDLEPTKKRS
jgi:hypothetical protein